MVAQACRDAKRRAVTAENLVEDFGHTSGVGAALMAALASELGAHLEGKANSKVRMLFEEWRTLFGQVADLTRAQEAAIRQAVPQAAHSPAKDAVPDESQQTLVHPRPFCALLRHPTSHTAHRVAHAI